MRALALLGLFGGVAIAAALVIANGIGPVWNSLLRVGWIGFGLVVLYHLALICLMGLAWWLLGRGRADAAPQRFVWGRLIREAASETLPLSQVGGFIIGARALALAGVSGVFAAGSTVVDVTVELVAQLAYTGLGLLLLDRLQPGNDFARAALFGVMAMSMAVVVFVSVQARGAGMVERVSNRLSRELLGHDVAAAGGVQASIRTLHARRGALLGATALHGASWVLSGIETWLTLQFMAVPLSLTAALIIDSLLYGVRSVAFMVPNAAGVQEGGLVLLGGMFGVSPEAALALSLVKRGRDLVIGLPALLVWQIVEGRRLVRFGKASERASKEALLF